MDDLIEGIYRLLMSEETRPVNIGNPQEMTILELARTVNSMLNNPEEFRMLPEKRGEGDPQRRRPDISRAREVLGWEPEVGLQEGLSRTLPYFQENL